MKFVILGILLALTLAGKITYTVKYDEAQTTDKDYPCFGKFEMSFSKNKALAPGIRYRIEEKGDWKYGSDWGVSGFGLDENEAWYACSGENAAETPSGVKCMGGDSSVKFSDFEMGDECKYSDYKITCDYDPDDKMGSQTVEKMEADEDHVDEDGKKIVEMQKIFWEVEFDTQTDATKEVTGTSSKAKVAKTKHDGDRAKECFATQFGGLVSAILVLTGLMN